MTTGKIGRGGRREGAGRPRVRPTQEDCVRELVFPAICAAYRASPTDGKYAAHFTIHLSKTDIREVYGKDGLATFTTFFTQVRKGGMAADGTSYTTRWEVPIGTYMAVKALVESLGHRLTDLPEVGFPPADLVRRAAEGRARAAARRQARLSAAVTSSCLDVTTGSSGG